MFLLPDVAITRDYYICSGPLSRFVVQMYTIPATWLWLSMDALAATSYILMLCGGLSQGCLFTASTQGHSGCGRSPLLLILYLEPIPVLQLLAPVSPAFSSHWQDSWISASSIICQYNILLRDCPPMMIKYIYTHI